MAYVAGVDYDSNAIHIALVDEDTLALEQTILVILACGPGDAFDRARRVRELMPARGKWTDAGVVALGLELPFTRQLNSLVALTRVQGAILACLPRDLTVLDLRPQEWKRDTVGKTNADKAAIRAWALEQGVADGLSPDFYDAYGIARSAATRWAKATHERGAAA